MHTMKLLKKYCFLEGRSLNRFGATYFKRHLGGIIATKLTSLSKGSSYLHAPERSTLLGATIGQLVDLAPERFGDRLAVIDCAQGIRKTHVEMKEDIDKMATGLLALNLQRGDRIAMWSPNRYEWVLTQMAAAKAGLILVPLNPAFQTNEFAYCLSKVQIRAVVIQESFKTQKYYEMIKQLVPQVAISKPGQIKNKTYPNFDTLIVLSDRNFPGTFTFKDVLNAGGSREKEKLEKLQTEIQFDDAVNIQFTSGTTGRSKAATLTHFGMNNTCVALSQRLGYFNSPARICGQVPLFHCIGCVGVTNTSIVSGTCSVFPSPGFSAEESLKSIEQEKCTSVYGATTMFIDMLNCPNFKNTDFSSIKTGITGGSTCSAEFVKEVMEKMNCPGLTVSYGSTELSFVFSIHDVMKDDKNKKATDAGKPIPNTQVKIVDSNDKIVPLGSTGEICVRGYNVMKGYWEDEEMTKEVIKDGWYHTGDIGALTDDGYLKVLGRIKDMIIRGGENIYPKEIEDYLISHPQISEAYVIGVPDKRLGEQLCVWIKLKTNKTINENDVRNFCKGQISHFKIPKYIRFVDNFPLTTSGKVQKYKMQEEMIKILGLEVEN